MKIDPRTISSGAAYQWMAATILPRPIAWVSTLNEDGTANLAPFSFFTGVGAAPPTCLICVSRKGRVDPGAKGEKKDTWSNVERARELVINTVPDALSEAMNVTSKEYARGVDEFEAAGVTKAPCELVAAPRVAEAPVALECRLLQIVEIGQAGEGTAVIICEILLWHVRDDVLDPGGRVDYGKLDLVGRLGGAAYARTRDRFDLVRPK